MKEGYYVAWGGDIVEVRWDDGPGFNTGGLMYSVDGQSYFELKKHIIKMINIGFEYLGDFED
jgi:hypothetical protein